MILKVESPTHSSLNHIIVVAAACVVVRCTETDCDEEFEDEDTLRTHEEEEHGRFEIVQVLKHRTLPSGKVELLIKWRGDGEDTWEPQAVRAWSLCARIYLAIIIDKSNVNLIFIIIIIVAMI